MTTDLPDLPDRLRNNARRWDALDAPNRAEIDNEAADEIDRLRTAIAKAANELAGDHTQDFGHGRCMFCWPADGGWPCVARAVADDLRALTGAAT